MNNIHIGGGNFPQRQQTDFKRKGFFLCSVVDKVLLDSKKRTSYETAPRHNILGINPISAFETELILLLNCYLSLKYILLSSILCTWKSQ